MSDLYRLGLDFLSKQSFSRLLGTELVEFVPGKAVLRLALRPEFLQQHGFAHGGVVSYLADNALTFAGGSAYGDAVTTEFKINYVRPAIGNSLTATAIVEHAGRNQAVVNCKVVADNSGEQKTVAIAQGTIARPSNGNQPTTQD